MTLKRKAPALKSDVLAQVRHGGIRVLTDARVSLTGFPFKVVQLAGTLSDPAVAAARTRVCDLGYLREAYRTSGGQVGFRCPAEPVAAYVAKGGAQRDTVRRQCLCNALMADIGLGQPRPAGAEQPLLTSGDGLDSLQAVSGDRLTYAAEVLDYLLN